MWPKPPRGREFVQVTAFTAFHRPRHRHVQVVDGPFPVDEDWSLEAGGGGTRVRFIAEGESRGTLRRLEPLAARMMARRFAAYHRKLRHTESGTERGNDGH